MAVHLLLWQSCFHYYFSFLSLITMIFTPMTDWSDRTHSPHFDKQPHSGRSPQAFYCHTVEESDVRKSNIFTFAHFLGLPAHHAIESRGPFQRIPLCVFFRKNIWVLSFFLISLTGLPLHGWNPWLLGCWPRGFSAASSWIQNRSSWTRD